MLGYAKQKGYAFMFKNHVYGIDLGSNMIKIYSQNSNEILKEKNMIAIRNKDTVLALSLIHIYFVARRCRVLLLFPVWN